MMRYMRENTKVILWIVVGAFVLTIFAVWGLDLQTGRGQGARGSTVIGRVNGVAITAQTFRQAYADLRQRYRDATTGGELGPVQQDLLRDQAWETLVNNILTRQEIERLGLEATDEEVLAFVRNSPPPEVQQFFLDENGNFDFTRYQQVISDPGTDPRFLAGLEADARQRIPLLKLNEILAAQVHVGEWEVRREWQARHTRMLAEFVRFPFVDDSRPEPVPTDEQLRAYFDAHREDFRQPEQAIVRWVLVPLEPTPTDREDVRYTVESIRDQIEAGEAFEDMAKTYSEAFTARVGGDAGFVRRGQRPDAVIDALAGLSPGQVSEPIATDDGMYLVQLVEKRTTDGEPEYHVREIFVKLRPGSATVDSVNTLAAQIRDEAARDGLEAAAAAHGLRAVTSAPFARGAPVDSLGFAPGVSRFAFAAEPGDVSRVLAAEAGPVVCELVRRIPERVPDFDAVRQSVSAALVRERRETAARHRADGFARTALTAGGEHFAQTAERYGVQVERTDTFTVDTPVADVAPRSPLHWAALEAEVGRPTAPVRGADAWYVVHVTWREPFDAEALRRAAPSIRSELMQQRVQEYITHWYTALRERAKIEDYRELL